MKFVKRALGIALIAVLASSLSILTTGVIVNAYVQSVMSGLGLNVDTPAPGFGGMLSSLMGTGGKASSKEEAPKETEKPNDSAAVAGSPDDQKPADSSKNTVPAATAENGSGGSPGEEKAPDNALPVMGGATEEQSGSAQDQQLVMTPEAMKDLKDNLPSADKVNIFNILMNKVPQEEMQKISTAMEDGLTEQEVAAIQSIISKYVTQDEYDKLMKLLTSGTEGQ